MTFTKDLNNFLTQTLKLPADAKCQAVKVRLSPADGKRCGFYAKRCFPNCRRCIVNDILPGCEMVTCWIIYSHKDSTADLKELLSKSQFADIPKMAASDFEAEFHCMLRHKASGIFQDITPDENAKRRVRRIVLEPRISAEEFFRFKFSIPENVANKAWENRTQIHDPNPSPSFFQMLEMLAFYRSVGTVVFADGNVIRV